MVGSDGAANESFGYSVAISGNTVVVGSLGGKAYVYEKPVGGWGNMVQTAELTSSTGEPFGPAVAISGNTIVVGSDGNGGYAYVFVRPSGGWTNMTQTAVLTGGVSGDAFGSAVAIDGETVAVGAQATEINGNQYQGAAYVFVRPPTGWASTSAFDAELTSSDGTYYDLFGISVGISGNTVVVGAPFNNGQTGPGAVYVYVEPEAGWASMTQTAELTKNVRGPYDEFGLAVAIAGNTIIAGAPQSNNDAGGAYIFVGPAAGWVDMTETADLTASRPAVHVGLSIGISGEQVVAGCGCGGPAVVYAEPQSGWQSTSTPTLSLEAGQTNSEFGFAVTISDGVVVAGAPFQTVEGNSAEGAAFAFQLTRP